MQKVLHYVSVMNRAGEETFLMNIFRKINKKNISFDFLCTSRQKGEYDKEIKKLGGNLYYVDLVKGKLGYLFNFFILRKKLESLAQTHVCFEIHTQHAMDAFFSSVAAKSAGFDHIIVHSHNSSTIYNIYTHYVFRFFLKHLNIIRFACGQDAGKWMFANKKFTVIKNGINVSEFSFNKEIRKKIREKYNWENKFIIGHVGRFNKQKNQEFLVKSFATFVQKNPDSLLVLIGEGELENEIKILSKKLGVSHKVVFLGVRDDVNELYQGMDLFVFPSLFEGLPVVLVEVQSSDLASVISNNITTEVDIIDNIYRLPVNTNEDEWAKLFYLIKKEKYIRRSRLEQIKKAGYDSQTIAQKLEKFYLSLSN